ncbi:MAG: Rrf2 family transcriptional regulator [Kiritimatiellae bacterium]|jgi:Rrf2 family cysteine metabolism transcriptional repressor|nr:Rrf2 family transcriptional regulator [Kiritimatiellia bacterium]
MISKKCTYALKAVLALARNSGGAPMTIHDIAKAEDIPPRFLEAILRDLKQSGLTDSIRGKDGGYRLTLPPHEISIGHVVRAVEGPWFPASESSERDVFTSVWDQADQALTDLLDQKNFQILVAEQDALRGDKVINYSI